MKRGDTYKNIFSVNVDADSTNGIRNMTLNESDKHCWESQVFTMRNSKKSFSEFMISKFCCNYLFIAVKEDRNVGSQQLLKIPHAKALNHGDNMDIIHSIF